MCCQCGHVTQPQCSEGKTGLTEGQGSPTEFDLDVAVVTVILPPILSLSFSCACSFAPLLSLIEALRKHADVVSCPPLLPSVNQWLSRCLFSCLEA